MTSKIHPFLASQILLNHKKTSCGYSTGSLFTQLLCFKVCRIADTCTGNGCDWQF